MNYTRILFVAISLSFLGVFLLLARLAEPPPRPAEDLENGLILVDSHLVVTWVFDKKNQILVVRMRNDSNLPQKFNTLEDVLEADIYITGLDNSYTFRHKRYHTLLTTSLWEPDPRWLAPNKHHDWKIPFSELVSNRTSTTTFQELVKSNDPTLISFRGFPVLRHR